jgi:glutamine cyclotransferase
VAVALAGRQLCCGPESGSVLPFSTSASAGPNEAAALKTETAASAKASPESLPMYECEAVHTFPHDRAAFTQGLVFLDDYLLESTGLKGRSSLRKVELASGRVLQQVRLSEEYFAEGLAVLGTNIFQLTWQNGKCFVYDLATFNKRREFPYSGEGWGLTTDGQSLIMSDGSERLRFLDPKTFKATRTITVAAAGRPLKRLNELEYVKGEIFANIWGSDIIARIDPASGKVLGLIDCTGLLSMTDYDANTDVLNGIAYDSRSGRLFVTGKHWPKLFEIRLKPKKNARN